VRTVVFDLDGTLADTSGDLIVSANACFEEMGAGAQLSMDADKGVALRGGRRMLTVGLTRMGFAGELEAEVDRWYPKLLDYYREAIDVHTVMFPGAMEAVDALKARGDLVSICTNKPEGLAELLLQRLGVRDAFDAMIGADTMPVQKPFAAPYIAAVERAGGRVARSLLVGDSDTDRNTARGCAVPSVLVSFGPSGEDMAALEPEALLCDYSELLGVVDVLLP